MIWLLVGTLTLLYLLLWPFTLRLDARLSPTSGRAELVVASLLRLRWEGDFLQAPYLTLYRLDRKERRKPQGQRRNRRSGFLPIIRNKRVAATLYVGMEGDGALTVETLGLAYAILGTLGKGFSVDLTLRPTACFDKNICALRLSGIGRFILAQNILEYRKGKNRHAKC